MILGTLELFPASPFHKESKMNAQTANENSDLDEKHDGKKWQKYFLMIDTSAILSGHDEGARWVQVESKCYNSTEAMFSSQHSQES